MRLSHRFIRSVAALGAMPLAAAAIAQPHHEEVQVGADASGRLHMHTHAAMPFPLDESPFPGITGWAGAEVALASLSEDHPGIGLFLLSPTCDIRAVFLGSDPGVQVYNGLVPMVPGEEMVLGAPVIHYMPVWNITSGTPGEAYALRFRFRDASGQYAESDAFEVTFTPVPAPGGALVSAGVLVALNARRRRRW